jgi:tetratricopeptide (TPR) repeat protein
MDSPQFFNDGIDERAKKFEELLNSGENFFYDTDELEEIIEFYLDLEQLNKASSAIEYGTSIYPYEVFYQIKRAEVAIARKDIKNAIKILEAARSIEPNNAEIAKALGDSYSITLQHKKAIDCYVFALNQGFDKEEMLLRLARIHFLVNNSKKAMNYLNAIPRDFVYDEFSLQELVKLFFDFSELDRAIEFLTKVINEDPYNYAAWYFKGLTLQKSEQYEKATTAFEYCIAIDENNTMGHLGKGNSLMELKDYNAAIESFKLSLDNDESDAEVLCNIAECFEQLENYSSAKYYYLRAIKTDKHLSDAFFGLAMIYKKQNKLKDAEKNLQKAIDLDSFESIYHIELAEVYLLLLNKERCLYHYQQAYEIDSDTPEIVLDFAHAHFEFKETKKAVELLKKHYETVAKDYRILYRIASYLFSLGHFENGYNYLHSALQIKPSEYFLLYEYSPFVENIENVSNIIDLYIQRTND